MASSRRQKRKAAGAVIPKCASRWADMSARSRSFEVRSAPWKMSTRSSEAICPMWKSVGRGIMLGSSGGFCARAELLRW